MVLPVFEVSYFDKELKFNTISIAAKDGFCARKEVEGYNPNLSFVCGVVPISG